MIEAKLRVERTEARLTDNPFYGHSVIKKVTEDTLMHDYDKRTDVAPFGVLATIVIGDDKTKYVFDIKINRYYFDYEGSGGYVAFFSIEEKVYEVWVKFDTSNNIENLWLSEWLQSGDFENGDDADNIYHMEDFTTFVKLLS